MALITKEIGFISELFHYWNKAAQGVVIHDARDTLVQRHAIAQAVISRDLIITTSRTTDSVNIHLRTQRLAGRPRPRSTNTGLGLLGQIPDDIHSGRNGKSRWQYKAFAKRPISSSIRRQRCQDRKQHPFTTTRSADNRVGTTECSARRHCDIRTLRSCRNLLIRTLASQCVGVGG